MNFEKLSKDYMKKYEELTEKRKTSGIIQTLEEINKAMRNADTEKVNSKYNEILDWNTYVSNLEGEKDAINNQFKFLKLPSVNMFSIAFDEDEKVWKFRGELNA